jgi:hypothetical protein
MMRYFWMFFCLGIGGGTFAQDSDPGLLSREAMTADLEAIVRALESSHVDPYRYRDSASVAAFAAGLRSELPDSTTVAVFWRYVDRLLNYFNDAHTRSYPTAHYRAFQAEGGTFLPVRVQRREEAVFITDTLGTAAGMEPGAQLLSVNGIALPELWTRLREHASKELTYLDDFYITRDFSYYLWRAYGWSGPFRVTVRHAGEEQTLSVPGVERSAFARRTGAPEPPKSVIHYEQLNDTVAYIRVRDFYSRGRKWHRQQNKELFRTLRDNGTRHLILDFRGHDGGDARYGLDLAAWFADRPYRVQSRALWHVTAAFKERFAAIYIPGALRWLRPLYVVNPHTRAIWRTPEGENATVEFREVKPRPRRQRFTGETYVLTDAYTFSAGSMFAAMVKDYRLATLVGRPTGNLSSFFADPIMWFRLPHSQITFQVSNSYNIRPSGRIDNDTVRPDVETAPQEDALERTLQLIRS